MTTLFIPACLNTGKELRIVVSGLPLTALRATLVSYA